MAEASKNVIPQNPFSLAIFRLEKFRMITEIKVEI